MACGAFEIADSSRGLAVEHGRVVRTDGTLVVESFQTRLMAQRQATLRTVTPLPRHRSTQNIEDP